MRWLLKTWIDRWGSWYQRGHNISQLKSWNLKPGPSNFKTQTRQEYYTCKPSMYRHDDAEPTISPYVQQHQTKGHGRPKVLSTTAPYCQASSVWHLNLASSGKPDKSAKMPHTCACEVRTWGPSENKFSKFHLVLFLPQSRTAELAGYVSNDYIISEEFAPSETWFHWAEPLPCESHRVPSWAVSDF